MARTKKDPCRRIKRSDAKVIWDDAGERRGNRQKIEDYGLTEDEVDSVLLDDAATVVANRSHPEHCLVFGYTYTGRFIAVAFEILDEDYPVIRPITAFEPEAD
jgi:uncharacterized DUF497 family protein